MTTYTVGPGKTYSTVTAAVAALPGGTFSAPQEIDIYWQSGGYDETGGVVLTGITPTNANPLIFQGMQAFTGVPGSQSLVYDSGNNGPFRVVASTQYIQWNNLEIDGGTAWGILLGGSNIFTINDCYLHNNSGSLATLATGGSGTFSVINSIIYGAGSVRPYDTRTDTSVTATYCFFGTAASDYCVISDTESTITDCYAFGGSTQTFYTGGSPAGNYNASSDNSATTIWGFFPSLGSIAAANVITSVATDWTLKAGANSLVNAGGVVSVTVDIIGTTRPQGAAPDMGPWERIVSSGGRANRLTLLGVC